MGVLYMDIVSYAIGYSKGVSDAPAPTPDPDTPEKYNLTEINGEFYIQGDEVKIRRNDVYTANIDGSDLYYHGASVITANGNNDTAYKYTKVAAHYSGDTFIVDFDEHGDILKFDDIECVLVDNVLYSTSKTEYKTIGSYVDRFQITFEDYADNFDSIWLTDVTDDWFCLRVDNNFSLDSSSAYMNMGDNTCLHGSTINYQTYSIYKPILFADLSSRLLAFDSEGYPIYTNKFEDDNGNAYYDPYFFKYDGHTYMWFNTINDPSVRSKLVFDDFDDPVDYSALGLITVSNVPMGFGPVESTGFIREIDMSDPDLEDINRFDPSMPFILPIINNNTGHDKYINGALLMPYMTNDQGVYKFSKLYELLESHNGVPAKVDGEFVVVSDMRYLAYVNGLLMNIYHPPQPDNYFREGAEHVEYFWEPQYPDVYVGNNKYVFKKSFKHLDMYDSTRYDIINTLTNRTYRSIGDLFYALHIEDGIVTVPEYGLEDSANYDYEVVDNHDYFYLDGVIFSIRANEDS